MTSSASRSSAGCCTTPSSIHAIGSQGACCCSTANRSTRIVALRTTDIHATPDGEITLRLGRGEIPLPEPLAQIAQALRDQQLQRTGTEGWLIPGRHAAQHITADTTAATPEAIRDRAHPRRPTRRAARARRAPPGADPCRTDRDPPVPRRRVGTHGRGDIRRLRRSPPGGLSRSRTTDVSPGRRESKGELTYSCDPPTAHGRTAGLCVDTCVRTSKRVLARTITEWRGARRASAAGTIEALPARSLSGAGCWGKAIVLTHSRQTARFCAWGRRRQLDLRTAMCRSPVGGAGTRKAMPLGSRLDRSTEGRRAWDHASALTPQREGGMMGAITLWPCRGGAARSRRSRIPPAIRPGSVPSTT